MKINKARRLETGLKKREISEAQDCLVILNLKQHCGLSELLYADGVPVHTQNCSSI